MHTFSELLTRYVRRTGISDSELARALGVRRQTVFRWKEGLVEKPRHREDVLRCADKLRLAPEERDELLLAAGFAPDSRHVPVGQVGASSNLGAAPAPMDPVDRTDRSDSTDRSDETTTEGPPAPGTIPEAPPPTLSTVGAAALPPRPGRLLHPVSRAALLAAGVALALLGGLGWLLVGRESGSYPVSGPGESLVVVGVQRDTAVPRAEEKPSWGMAVRLLAALEREVQAARLDRVRIAAWPHELPDLGAAETVALRSGATVVLGGTQSASHLAALVVWAPDSGPEDLALDALVSAPSSLQVKIDAASQEEVRTLALLTLGLLQARRGDHGPARATLAQALANPPADPETLAALHMCVGHVHQISAPPDLSQAILSYGKALDLLDSPMARLNRGLAYLRLDQAEKWKLDLERVVALDPDHPDARQALCWAHVLDGRPDLALPHCDAAVSWSPAGYARQARAVAYAQLGRLAEGAADLRAFVEWLERQPESLRGRHGTVPREWLEMLQSGRNPIDQAILEDLRRS